MHRVLKRALTGAPLLLACALPSPALGAYAPKLSVTVDPATPNAATALTSVVTQLSGETASKRVRLVLPTNFKPAMGTQLKPCNDAQVAARACPEESRMGAAEAQTGAGRFSGTVNYGPVSDKGIRFFIFLSNGIALLDQTIEGTIIVTPTGFVTELDGLPDVATTSFKLSLAGAPRSLLANPRDCGDYLFKAEFTSQRDEQATSESSVKVAPCKNKLPRVTNVTAKGRTIRYSLSEAAQVSVQVKRGKTVVFERGAAAAPAGKRTVRISKKLKKGRYRVVVRALDAEGGRGLGSGRLVVKR